MLSIILLSRLIPYVYEVTGGHHCGLQHGRSITADEIFCIHQILLLLLLLLSL
jgi:hypothetical protein